MSALANHAFNKMNGIGNEIVVVDLRDRPAAVTAEEARAVASPAGVPYDQLMVLQPPRLPAPRPSSASTIMMARKRRLRQRHALRGAAGCSRPPARPP